MAKNKKLVGVPKWLSLKPSEKITALMKEYSYDYMRNAVKKGSTDQKITQLIPEFIDLMGQHEPLFTRIKSKHIKTTFTTII